MTCILTPNCSETHKVCCYQYMVASYLRYAALFSVIDHVLLNYHSLFLIYLTCILLSWVLYCLNHSHPWRIFEQLFIFSFPLQKMKHSRSHYFTDENFDCIIFALFFSSQISMRFIFFRGVESLFSWLHLLIHEVSMSFYLILTSLFVKMILL